MRRAPTPLRRTFLLAFLCASHLGAASDQAYDVIEYGGTLGGIAAEVAAARGGHSVSTVEPTRRVGGMMTNGLSYSDFLTFESLTGFFLESSRKVEADYRKRYGPDSPQVQASWRGTHGEPSVNLRVFQALLEQHKVRVYLQHSLTHGWSGQLKPS